MRETARRLAPALLALGALVAPGPAAAQTAGPSADSATAVDAGPVARVGGMEDALVPGPSVAERLSEIRRRVQDAVVYPPLARRQGLDGVTLVRFEIDARGRATGLAVARTSGHWILDRAAARGVRRAGLLPYVYGRLEIPVRFSLAHAR